MSGERVRRLPLDHLAGFVLSRIEGALDLETLVEISAMPREQVLHIVRELELLGVVEFR